MKLDKKDIISVCLSVVATALTVTKTLLDKQNDDEKFKKIAEEILDERSKSK